MPRQFLERVPIPNAALRIREYKESQTKTIKRGKELIEKSITWKDLGERTGISSSLLRAYVSRGEVPLQLWNQFWSALGLDGEVIQAWEDEPYTIEWSLVDIAAKCLTCNEVHIKRCPKAKPRYKRKISSYQKLKQENERLRDVIKRLETRLG